MWKKQCCVQKWRMSLCVICRYYNIPFVSLIKNAKILKFISCEIEHNYSEQKMRVLATLVYAWYTGIQSHHHGWLHCVRVHRDIQSHCHGWLHCVWVHGDIQPHHHDWLLVYAGGQSGSGHYQVLHWGSVWVYISSISWDGGLLFWEEWQGTAGAVPVSFGVTDCAWGGMCTLGVFCSVWGIAAGWGVVGATHGPGCTAWVAGGCVGVARAIFVVTCLSGLMASGWCSCMWL